MLNSAAGVMFPTSKYAPPINTICLILSIISGAFCSAVPILVSGPRGQRVIDFFGASRKVFIIKSTAWVVFNSIFGSGNVAPSKPVLP